MKIRRLANEYAIELINNSSDEKIESIIEEILKLKGDDILDFESIKSLLELILIELRKIIKFKEKLLEDSDAHGYMIYENTDTSKFNDIVKFMAKELGVEDE